MSELVTSEKMPVLGKHWGAVRDAVEHGNRLQIPEADLAACIAELDQAMQPQGRDNAKEVTFILIGSYRKSDVPDPEIFARAITSVFMDYPRSVSSAAVDRLTREMSFLPSRKEVYEACEREMAVLRVAKRRLTERAETNPEPVDKSWQKKYAEKHGANWFTHYKADVLKAAEQRKIPTAKKGKKADGKKTRHETANNDGS